MAVIKTESASLLRSGYTIFVVLLLVLAFASGGAPFQERVIASAQVGECRLTVEADDQWHALRLRALHPHYKNCHIDQESMLQVLRRAFSEDAAAKLEAAYSSLFIGRIIDYPWLSQYLATTAYRDRAWNSKKGRPRAAEINSYVSRLLSSRQLLAQFSPAFSGSGYKIVDVNVEKVLVGTSRDVPGYSGALQAQAGRVPFDAMLWFRLAGSSG